MNQSPAELLRQCVSPEVFEDFRDDYLKDRQPGVPLDKSAHNAFMLALKVFFEKLPETGVMKRCDLADYYAAPLMRAWNALVDQLSPEDSLTRYFAPGELADAFVNALMWHIRVEYSRGGADMRLLPYEEMVDFIACGTIKRSHPEAQVCQETGLRIHTFIKDWSLDPCTYKADERGWRYDGKFTPLPPAEEDSAQHATINFPTGRVVYGDMIRLAPVMKLYKQHAFVESNSSIRSLVKTTKQLAKHNILHTFAGNSSPYIYTAEGALTVGHDNEDRRTYRGNFKPEGHHVCTDLWAVTMMDEAVLIDLMAETMSREQAEFEVKNYLRENEPLGQRVIQLEPGEYNLYFHGDQHRLRKKFDTSDIEFGDIEYQFVLSKKPITFTPKLKLKNAPKV